MPSVTSPDDFGKLIPHFSLLPLLIFASLTFSVINQGHEYNYALSPVKTHNPTNLEVVLGSLTQKSKFKCKICIIG